MKLQKPISFHLHLRIFLKPNSQEEQDAIRELWTLYQDTVQQPEDQEPVELLLYIPPEDSLYEPQIYSSPHSPPRLYPDEPNIIELLVLPEISNCFGDSSMLQQDEMYANRIYNTVSKTEGYQKGGRFADQRRVNQAQAEGR